jgi:hypothetical protein
MDTGSLPIFVAEGFQQSRLPIMAKPVQCRLVGCPGTGDLGGHDHLHPLL